MECNLLIFQSQPSLNANLTRIVRRIIPYLNEKRFYLGRNVILRSQWESIFGQICKNVEINEQKTPNK